ncbi:glycosyl hydrolase family protein [bacterium]|nr:MAG: glycosyl hydrolase family protein [bacterium]
MAAPFRFGVATADHQCEAYTGQDDIRDVWERVRGLTPRGRATDFWQRYREDVDLAKGLGCRAFRLSLAWARLEPEPGRWDDEAFQHYRDVLQYLRDAEMVTIVTLHHNAWPLHVQAAGNGAGMLDANFPTKMAAYAAEVARRLGDLIDYYVTLNEPNQLVYGFIKGFWMRAYAVPPGLEPYATSEQQMDAVLQLIPNLFRAHALARRAILHVHPQAKVGANPLVLGLPRWLQRLADRNATHLPSQDHARRQAARLSQRAVLDSGKVDVSIAQIAVTDERIEGALFSEPYAVAPDGRFYAVAMALGSRALLNAVDRALRDLRRHNPNLPDAYNRKTVAHIGREHLRGGDGRHDEVPDLDRSLQAIRKRGVLRVGIHPGVEGLCMPDGKSGYRGLEPEIAQAIARRILGSPGAKVRFVPLHGEQRLRATRSWLRMFDDLRKSYALFTTLLGANWWNLGMAGRLPQFLCPPECAGTLDYVGVDYYWGVPSVWPRQLQRLFAAGECRYSNAPVWPGMLEQLLYESREQFPGKPVIVIENGCVTSADGFSRADYLSAHIREVRHAVEKGVPVVAYLCWSITSNREWGLPFDDNSDFGLYHIDLDHDPDLKRMPTEASKRYAEIIAQNRGGTSMQVLHSQRR